MEELEKDNTKEAYNLSNYDLIYVLLKEGCQQDEVFKKIVKYDKVRKKYFISGRVVEMTGYPKYQSLAFVPENNIEPFRNAKKTLDKQKLVINLRFGCIDFIMLPFDNFDWKK